MAVLLITAAESLWYTDWNIIQIQLKMHHSKSALSELFRKPLHVHMGKVEGGGVLLIWLNWMLEAHLKQFKFHDHKKHINTINEKTVWKSLRSECDSLKLTAAALGRSLAVCQRFGLAALPLFPCLHSGANQSLTSFCQKFHKSKVWDTDTWLKWVKLHTNTKVCTNCYSFATILICTVG